MTTTTTTYRTLTARFAGRCLRCGDPIIPGQTIRYGGKGRTYHLATDCPKGDDAPDAPDAATTPAQLQALTGQATGEGWSEYGRRALFFALQLDAPCYAGIDNDGLQAGADVCNHAMAARGVSDVTIACLTALQRGLRATLRARRADTAQRLAGLQTAPAAAAPVATATPDAPPAGPQGGGGSKVKAPKGPQRPTPPAMQLPQLVAEDAFF